MTARSGRGRLAAVMIGVAVALLAGACGSQPEPRYAEAPDAAPPAPALDTDQVGRVLMAVDEATSAARAGLSAKLFDDRAAGPYREINGQDFTLAKKQKKTLDAAEAKRSLVVVPVQVGWPRFFLTVGTLSDHEAPVVQVFRSESARDAYALWAELQLLPGQQWPQVNPDPTQVEALAPDLSAGDLELLLSPEEVAADYAKVLTKGRDGAWAEPFAKDEFSSQVRKAVAAEEKTLKEVATVKSTHKVDDDGVLAVRLGDGSALVIVALTQEEVITVKKGSGTVTIAGETADLLGKKTIEKKLTRRAAEVVALQVPATGMRKVTVIAAQKGDVKVSGS